MKVSHRQEKFITKTKIIGGYVPCFYMNLTKNTSAWLLCLAEVLIVVSTAQAQEAGANLAAQWGAALPHDLSPWSMFLNATLVVKLVMVGLAFASLVTWTIALAKSLELLRTRKHERKALALVSSASSLTGAITALRDAHLAETFVAELAMTAANECETSADLAAEGIKERVSLALSRVDARAGRAMAVGTGLLATIGSTAPFVGLFGTVWGIMNSFIGISQSRTTNLAVVAPGIAEALLATAMGLFAAIPAVLIYNQLTRGTSAYRAQLADASAVILSHLSRDLDRRDQAQRRTGP